MPWRIFSTLVLAWSLASSLPARAAPECALREQLKSLFAIQPEEGVPLREGAAVIKRALPYKKLDYELNRLGKGNDGFVTRVVPKESKSTFIVKLMDRHEAVSDQIGFEVLRTSLEGNPVFKLQKAKVLPGKPASPRAFMQLGDSPGRTLFSVLSDPAVPDSVKSHLRLLYRTGMEELRTRLKSDWGLEVNTFSPLETFFPSAIAKPAENRIARSQPPILGASMPYQQFFNLSAMDSRRSKMFDQAIRSTQGRFMGVIHSGEDLMIILKSDNVIVTPEYELVIIDPK